jgi:hypothetical protein
MIKNLKEYEIPKGPEVKVLQPKDEENKFTRSDQEECRSGIGSLM